MTNPLKQVNESILNDPHGTVARRASHWLAVEVMEARDGYMKDPLGRIVKSLPIYVFGKRVIKHKSWQPFTNANHTLMVCEKLGVWFSWSGKESMNDFLIKLIESALGLCHSEGTLTDETLEGWLEND